MDHRKSHKKTGQTNTLPEQSFKTPLPMQEDEFDKFLKENDIDVESVTTPLRYPVSKIVESWKPNNKGSKLSSSFTGEQNIADSLKLKTQKFNGQKHQDNRRDIYINKMATYTTDYMDKTDFRDPLRFTHMFNDNTLKFTSTNSPLRDSHLDKDVPNRVQIKGHSFKYDIIFNKECAYRNQDAHGPEIDLSPYKNINDDNPIVEEPVESRQCDRNAKVDWIKFIPSNIFEKSKRRKHGKRDLQDPPKSFTAKDVAALEVVVDLLKSTQGVEEKDNAIADSNHNKHIVYTPLVEKENQLNSIQVHIAIPSLINDKKRSMESINVRKVFSAIMSTPVDLEYQIHSFDESTKEPTTVKQDILSPGLYLLVENTNITCPKGNFALKPLSSLEPSNLKIRHATVSSTVSSESFKLLNNTENLYLNTKIKNICKHFTTVNNTIWKRNIYKNFKPRKIKIKTNNNHNKKRNIDFNVIRKFLKHDRVCNCRCKVNETMCKPCAESDKVISELIFEFDNLEQYVVNHCTEIQTFFWMNPTDGKKLRNVIRRIDKILNNYYKRIKGKCQGRTCQMISSNIDKRSFDVRPDDHQLIKRLVVLFDNLKNMSEYIHDTTILLSGRKSLRAVNNCLTKQIYKRSFLYNDKEIPMKSIYSLNNIKINLICDKDNTKTTSYLSKNKIIETNTYMNLYNDTNVKEKKKSFKQFLKKCSKRKKAKKIFYYDTDEYNKRMTPNLLNMRYISNC